MNHIYIFGDSHAGRMANTTFEVVQEGKPENSKYSYYSSDYIDRVFDHVDGGGREIFHSISAHLFSIKNEDIELTIASTPGRSALNFDYNFYRYMDSWDGENSIVMPWLGYIDIKNWLPQKNLKNYKNVDEVVDIYVEKTLSKFKNSRIIFINPMPQFEIVMAARWANYLSDPAIEFEERHSTHLEFIASLMKKTKSVGLEDPIDISEILNVPWIDTSMQFKKPIKEIYNDHLMPEFYAKILKEIINKI